jgi:hypothetical protein
VGTLTRWSPASLKRPEDRLTEATDTDADYQATDPHESGDPQINVLRRFERDTRINVKQSL